LFEDFSLSDWLVLIPLLPALPFLISWWLPWDRWLPWEEMAPTFLGPYLLYAAFAAWYFKLGGWYVLLLILAGLGVSTFAITSYRSED
jgi:hypothetical protein